MIINNEFWKLMDFPQIPSLDLPVRILREAFQEGRAEIEIFPLDSTISISVDAIYTDGEWEDVGKLDIFTKIGNIYFGFFKEENDIILNYVMVSKNDESFEIVLKEISHLSENNGFVLREVAFIDQHK